MKKIAILNGPNLNLLGQREPGVYGRHTLAELEEACRSWAVERGADAVCRQSNHEGQLIDWLHASASDGSAGIVLNAGGYTHTSVALRDAIAAIAAPVVEVHISNVHAREAFRHRSLIAPVCAGSISGFGVQGYKLAIYALIDSTQSNGAPTDRA